MMQTEGGLSGNLQPMPQTFHLTPSTLTDHLAAENEWRENKIKSGRSRAYARRNQMLTYGGDTLTPGQVTRLISYLDRVAKSGRANIGDVFLSAILTTGRPLRELADVLSRKPLLNGSTPPPLPTLAKGDHWVWWFQPGRPSSEQKFHGENEADQQAELLPIFCSDRTRVLIEQIFYGGKTGLYHFDNNPVILAKEVRGACRAAEVSVSLKNIEAWLFHQIARGHYGDPAIAAIITGRAPPIVQSVLHYTQSSASAISSSLTAALCDFDQFSNQPVVESKAHFGSRFTPTQQDVRALTDCVKEKLMVRRRSNGNVARLHNALTVYTTLMHLFATGGRPAGTLIPSSYHIDPETGFTIVDDKVATDGFSTRLVWVPPDCRDQIRYYEEHLERLADKLPDLRLQIEKTVEPFLLRKGKIVRLDQQKLREELRGLDWRFPLNAGRHYLRSELVSNIESEALHALLGHWHLGIEPWSKEAALDPLLYRKQLSGVLPDLLRKAGFLPMRGL